MNPINTQGYSEAVNPTHWICEIPVHHIGFHYPIHQVSLPISPESYSETTSKHGRVPFRNS